MQRNILHILGVVAWTGYTLSGCAVQGPQLEQSNSTQGSIFVSEAANHPAAIYLDHLPTGLNAPGLIENVPAGRHIVHLISAGYHAEPDSIEILLDADAAFGTARFTLARLPSSETAQLNVNTSLSGAAVSLNGVLRGYTPLTIEALDPGYYTVSCWRGNYRASDTTIAISPGSSLTLNRPLVLYPAVVLEQFSHTDCTPGCPLADAAIDKVLEVLDSIAVIRIAYHTSTLGKRDPLYAFDPTNLDARSGFYGIDFVPRILVNGTALEYNTISQLESRLNSALRGARIDKSDGINFTNITCTPDRISGSVIVDTDAPVPTTLRILLVEHIVSFDQAPGINGQTVFHQVCRGMFPDAAGISLTATAGTSCSFNFVIDQIDSGGLMLCALLQNDDSKTIIRAITFDLEEFQP
jgi:hypothetical protein